LTKLSKYIIVLIALLLASSSYAQSDTSAKISLELTNASIGTVVSKIESQTYFHFYYDTSALGNFNISYQTASKKITTSLAEIFTPLGIQFYFDNQNNIFLTKSKLLSLQISDNFFTGKKQTGINTTKDFAFDTEELGPIQEALVDKKIYEIGDKALSGTKNIVALAGFIKDNKTGEPVGGTSVYIDKPRIGVTTDQYGFYTISLPKGRHLLNIQSIGMRDVKRQIVLYSDGNMDIDLQGSIMSLKRVVISSQKISNVRGTQMGVQKLDIKTVKQVPVVFGEADILRVVTTLPGVKTVGEASTGLNVRGGSSDQNLILFNDATIYNPAHFFGMFSAFNPELINSVELYKASIPANYGGRLSSVLDITSREGNKKEFTGSAGIGLLTSRVNVEGPLVKDKSSFILGGRTTYSNWLFNYLPEDYKNGRADFYDLNLIVNHQIDKNNTLYFTGYISNDHFNLNSDTAYGYGNKNLSVKWKHIYTTKLNSLITVGNDNYNYAINSKKLPLSAYQLGFSINQSYFKAHFNYNINSKHSIDYGVNSIYYSLNPGNYTPLGEKSLIKPDIIPTEQAIESALYASEHYTITSALKLDAGIRFSVFNVLGAQSINEYPAGIPRTEENILRSVNYASGTVIKTYGGPEYRLALRYVIDETFSLKASYNTQRQYIHSLSNTTAMAPTDVWKLSDPNIKPQIGDQISFGLYKNLKSNTIETSLEVYYKNIENYLDYKSGAKLVMNHHIETDVIGTKGKAYGVEFLVKKLSGKLNGWISYTWSRILLRMNDPTAGEIINKGEFYPGNYDKPNDVTVIANYRFSHRFSVSMNGNYSTGRPITLPVGLFSYGGSMRTLYADRNAYRIPDYFRTDFSMNIEGNHKVNQLFHNSWSIGVYNLTGRKNPYSIYYVSENGMVNGYKLSIFGNAIPYINLNIKFK
jgi:CarboxypepD_reg-like domain/TonB-dependent Receptor Plug Domain